MEADVFHSGGIIANVLITVVVCSSRGPEQRLITLRPSAAQPAPGGIEVTSGMPAAQAGLCTGAGDQDRGAPFGDLHFPGSNNDEAIALHPGPAGCKIPVVLNGEGRERTLTVSPATTQRHR